MEILPEGAGRDAKPIVTYSPHPQLEGFVRPQIPAPDSGEENPTPPLDLRRMLRRYWPLLLVMVFLGTAAGFAYVVLKSPVYKARLLLEVQNVNEAFMKNSLEVITFEANEVNIQTQLSILRSGPFLRRGAERLRSETVPLAPTGQDPISRLRQRIRPATQDPLENARRGLNYAIVTFDARPVNRTRLIELTCDSTS